jgi:hypothetical protein
MPTQAYSIKWLEETAWFVVYAVATFLFTTLADLATVSDWKTWALSLAVGAGRVAAAIVLNQLLKLKGA